MTKQLNNNNKKSESLQMLERLSKYQKYTICKYIEKHCDAFSASNFLKDCYEDELIDCIKTECNSAYSIEYLKTKNKDFLIDYIKRFINNEKWDKAEITNEHKEVFDLIKEYNNQSKKTYRYNNPISRDKSNDVNEDCGYIDGVDRIDTFVKSFNISNATVSYFKNRQYWTGVWHPNTFGFQLESDNKIIEVYAYHNWILIVNICFFEKQEDIKDVVDINRSQLDIECSAINLHDSNDRAVNENVELYYRKIENMKDINDRLFNQISKMITDIEVKE